MNIKELSREELISLVIDLVDALDYCGWGDSYEREGSSDLRNKVHAMDMKV